ncbi:MAG: cytochrome P460 family protein [Proteobacteria bacterium]|nr:cytochrome P460 family protein [Pseudomonadota bacterium]
MMRKSIQMALISLGFAAVACGGGKGGATTPGGGGGDQNAVYGPLEVGADWESYTKVNSTPSNCTDHGGRLCDTYVNDVGLEAYKNEDADIPSGTIIVKQSWEKDAQGNPGARGPLFIMAKKDAGFDDAHANWYYAMHWENPTEKWAARLGGPVYWRSPSAKVNYCWGCHDGYDRALGMVPEENRAW